MRPEVQSQLAGIEAGEIDMLVSLGRLIGGSVIMEMVFPWPVVGRLIIDSILKNDFPMVQASIIVLAASIALVNRLVEGRFRVARLQRFVADSSRRELIVPHTPLTPLTPEQVASGLGTSGIFTVVEPPNLDLYRSYIPEPLRMPAVPEVAMTLVDAYVGELFDLRASAEFLRPSPAPSRSSSPAPVTSPTSKPAKPSPSRSATSPSRT